MSAKSKIKKIFVNKNSVIPAKAPVIAASQETAVKSPASAPTSPPTVDGSTRAAVATAMGRSADTAAVAALVRALRDPDADVAREAATALGRLGDPYAVEPLIEALTNADGYYHSIVRAAAAISLGQLRDRRAVEPLMSALKDPIAEVCTEAIGALSALGDGRAVVALNEVVRNSNGFFLPIACSTAISALARLDRQNAVSV